ncbi:MAG: hypothetical protein ACXVB0_00410 [Mucilaginibacter sp.]
MLKATRLSFIILFSLFFVPYAYSQNLNNEQIQSIANKLLISNKYKVHIKKVLPIVNDIQVVVLDLPYREFPGIILISKNKATGKWERTFECLSPGIQDKPSGLLDWHTKGEGVDFMIDNVKIYSFEDKKIKAVVETSIKKDGPVVIPYQYFIHMNTASSNPPGYAPYTIDKTQYFDLANILFDDLYKGYPQKECTMFDTPAIQDCEFTFNNNSYTITATTSSNQVWTYTFEGIDGQNRYLLNKKIAVRKGL